ncbi:MAG: TRAP transporter substrate-binding protein DctP [bacterium]
MQRAIRAWLAGVVTVAALFVATPETAHAGKVKIKLATLAPQGSAWENLLLELAEKWKEQSNGDVELKVYSGGVTGNEGDTVTKMGVGQVQAAAITIVGMRNIDPAPQAAGVPGLLTTDAEFNYVVEKMEPVWEKRLLEKGYVVLSWGDTGWIHFFAKKALHKPADAEGVKIFAWAGDPNAVEAWKASGFQPVVLSSTDMMTSLTTGMIESFATGAIMANAARWYEQAKYMPDIPWGRLLTATLVKKDTWEKIDPALQPKLMETARSFGTRINAEVGKLEADSIKAMQQNGLEVIHASDAERAEWATFAEKSWPSIRGKVVPEDQFDMVKKLRDEFRAKGGK